MTTSRALLPALLLAASLGGCVAPGADSPTGGPGGLAIADDSDLDGVANADDACPRTRVTDAIDARGCTPFTGVIEGVDFPSGGTSLTAASREALDPVVEALLQRPDVRLEIQGHTDNRGPAAGNLVLSKRRVMAVVRFLVSEGVPPQRLEPWGYGENRPLASNATAEGRATNRRIEVRALVP